MIEISKSEIHRFHDSIDDYSSYDKCWNICDTNEKFTFLENRIEKNLNYKVFSYLIYCSCEVIHPRVHMITQICDNPNCCNPFHLHPFIPCKSKEGKIFEDMLSRMRNPNNPFYKDYGGRGLELDDRWNPDLHLRGVARINFYYDIHELGFQPGLSIDRIDNNKGYLKNNVRFVDWKIQGQNRRTTKLTPDDVRYIRENYIHYGWQSSNTNELAEKFGIHPTYVLNIVQRKYWKNIT